MKDEILNGLNQEQLEAVTHKTGPLLIIAGAGTGKTTVITRRIAWLIEQKICKPSEILALTFTEKAAAEMEERVDLLVPYGYTDMWISTFHAFGDRLLRDYSLDLGLPANFKILTKTEQAIFFRENIYAFDLIHFRPIADPLSHIQSLLNHFSRLKDELISPEAYQNHIDTKIATAFKTDSTRRVPVGAMTEEEKEKQQELARVYGQYQELMIQSGNLDFGDQIFYTYKLLKEHPQILKDCQEKFKFILVDEFQDTNYAQNEIVKLLAGKNGNLTVVGDDDQAIYRFRGASISNILDFKKAYPQLKQVVLNNNYRSTQEILDASYKLIQNNNPDRLEVKNHINKKLVSTKQGTQPELLHCDTLSCEADTVVTKIQELAKTKGLDFNEFAILVRANNQATPFIQSLNLAGIPFIFSGASSLFEQPEIKMLIAFLKSLVYDDDNLAFYQLATSDLYNIDHLKMTELYTQATRGNRSILSLIESSSPDDQINNLVSDIKKYSVQKNESVGEVLYDFLTSKKYLHKLTQTDSVENEIKIHNIAKFFERIAQFNHSASDRGVINFLKNLELILEVGDETETASIDPEIKAVNILTVHAAKGLEWPVVFIINCVADRFPSRRKREALPIPEELIKERMPEGDYHLEEERRLFYVAATRAKDWLFLSSADDYGGKRTKKLSQFVLELLGEPQSQKVKHHLTPSEKIERFKKIETCYHKLPNKFTGDILRLSRQQIDDYYSCPKKFYFAHVVKIPLLENQHLMYGTAIHAALDHYFRRKIKGEKPELQQLVEDFKQNFRNVGFITRDQEELRKRQGLETLARFYDTDIGNTEIPNAVEQEFEFTEDGVKIIGRYDLVFKNMDNYEIRDFKTSDVREQKDADRRIKESTQMMIYALAWQEKYGSVPKTSLHFIESGLTGEITFTENDLEKTKELILDVKEGLKKNDLAAKPDFNTCKWCAYKDICPEAI